MHQDTELPAHPSELELHAHLMAALPPGRAASVQEHTAACARCSEALGELHAAHRAFDRSVLPRTRAALEARAWANRRRRGWRWLWAVFPVTAAAAAAVVTIRVGGEVPAGSGDLQVKGTSRPAVAPRAALEVFATRGTAAAGARGPGAWFAVLDGATRLRAGDEIRFVLRRPPELRHVLVVGVGAGEGGGVTVYHPYGGRGSAPLATPAMRVELAATVVLDAAAGPERLFALFGRAPIDLGPLQPALAALARGGPDAVRQTAALPVAVDAQSSVLLEREGSP